MSSDLTEKTLGVKRVFTGRAVKVDVAEIRMPSGRLTTREILRHRGASVILGELPDGRFVLVRQYRRAVEQTLLEAVAGCREEGESFETCARREMEEESGYKVAELVKLGVSLPSPGYSEEEHHLYYAKLMPEQNAQRPDFDENLEPVYMTPEQIDAAIAEGSLIDGKTLIAWMMWRNRS